MYSPRISDNQIKKLYILKKRFKLPMTIVVRIAIDEYLKRHADLLKKEEELRGVKSGTSL